MTVSGARTGLEIAVIGVACRFPGARNACEFWENLKGGAESITRFSEEELRASGIGDKLIGDPRYVPAKGYLEGCEDFAHEFFDYTRAEAEIMDPQLRLLHECAWEALEGAGYGQETGRRTAGLYVGGSPDHHWYARVQNAQRTPAERYQAMTLNDNHSFSTRLSYQLNLTGPSFTLQSACSSSLVAVHSACRALLGGECYMAIAGGVSLTFPVKSGYIYHRDLGTSPDGHCRPFDEGAQGTLVGDGVGLVVLKRLEDALADNDYIHAVIKGSAVSNDGREKLGYAAPGIAGLVKAVRSAQYLAEVKPENISYIEAYSTGTLLGDSAEVEALRRAFNTSEKGFCAIGSVKANIGHLNHAAGIAAFIKTVLALSHRMLPPSAYFLKPNPAIDFDNSPFYINRELVKWSGRDGAPLRAGVNSSGIGGTNVHVVLEEAPPHEASAVERPWKLLLLSAKTEAALTKMTENMSRHLTLNPALKLDDLAYTTQVGRAAFKHRRAVVCTNLLDAATSLETPDAERAPAMLCPAELLPVVFVFPWEDEQYAGTGWELYISEPAFRDEVRHLLALLQPEARCELEAWLGALAINGQARAIPVPTELAQQLLFIFEYALAKLLQRCGITPAAMLGIGIGECVWASLVGLFKFEEMLAVMRLRDHLKSGLSVGREEFRRAAAGSESREPTVPCISGLTGNWITTAEACDAEYWLRRWCHTEPTHTTPSALLQTERALLISLGPVTAQSEAAKMYRLMRGGQAIVNVVQDAQGAMPADACLLRQLGALWLHGLDIKWDMLHKGQGRRRIPLPTYPFERRRFVSPPESTELRLVSSTQGDRKEAAPVASHEELEHRLKELWREFCGRDVVSIHEGFFELGGDSLKAIGLTARINHLLDVQLQVSDLLRAQTISNLATYLRALKGGERVRRRIQPVEKREYYPLSFIQQSILMPENLSYETRFNLGGAFEISRPLEPSRLQSAFQKLIERHELLRTSFSLAGSQIVQRIWPRAGFLLPFVRCTEAEARERFKTFTQPFDLGRPPLLKAELLQVATEKYYLLIDMHHAIYDSVSIGLMIEELWSLYDERPLPPVLIHYKDYAVWQDELLAAGELDRHERYWLSKLHGLRFARLLPDGHEIRRPTTYSRSVVNYEPDLTASLTLFCNQFGVTKLSFLLSVFMLLLSRHSKLEDIAIGLRVSNRFNQELERMMGCFLEKVIIRTRVAPEAAFRQYLSACNEVLLDALDNALYPCERLLDGLWLDVPDAADKRCHILVNYVPAIFAGAGVETRFFSLPREVASKYHINLRIRDEGQTIALDMKYRSDIYSGRFIAELLGECVRVTAHVIADPGSLNEEILRHEPISCVT